MSIASVRLTTHEKESIRAAVDAAAAAIGVTWKRVSLFGSRTDPSAKGGDIDLYVEIEVPDGSDAGAFPARVRLEMENRIGERKVDLIIDDGHKDLGAFGALVRTSKVDLWTKS